MARSPLLVAKSIHATGVALLLLLTWPSPAQAVSGKVTAGGLPVAGAQITLFSSLLHTNTVTSDAAGNWSYSDPFVPDDTTYRVLVTKAGYMQRVFPDVDCLYPSPGLSTCDFRTAGTAVSKFVTNVDVALVPGGKIRGTISGPTGAIAGAEVRLMAFSHNSTSRATFLVTTTTGAGAYEFAALPNGTYFVWAGQPDQGLAVDYIGTFFPDQPCTTTYSSNWPAPPCIWTAGSPVVVSGLGTTTANIVMGSAAPSPAGSRVAGSPSTATLPSRSTTPAAPRSRW